MSEQASQNKSPVSRRSILSLLLAIAAYAAPRGNTQIRNRIIGAFACLILAKSSNIVTPLLYGGAVDYVNGDAGFSTLILWYILGLMPLAVLASRFFPKARNICLAGLPRGRYAGRL